MKKILIEYSAAEVATVAKQCIDFSKDCSVVTLTGSLGAGKTTLVSHMMQELGVADPIVSPTFTYLNVYVLADGRKAYHFDLYRLNSLVEFEQAGFGEYLYQEDSICLIEWPEIVMPLLTHSACHIQIDFLNLEKRKLTAVVT